jgi:hypothetical protein
LIRPTGSQYAVYANRPPQGRHRSSSRNPARAGTTSSFLQLQYVPSTYRRGQFRAAFGTKRAKKGRVAVCCKTSRPALTCCRKSVISPRTPSNCVDAELGMYSTRLQRSVGKLHAQQPSPWSSSSYSLLVKAGGSIVLDWSTLTKWTGFGTAKFRGRI